jgi:hypothetical protein
MRAPRADTIAAVRALHREHGSFRKAADALDDGSVTFGTLSNIQNAFDGDGDLAHGISVILENRVRLALGLAPIGAETIESCPSCGEFHSLDDCLNEPGVLRMAQPKRPRVVSDASIDLYGLDAFSKKDLAAAFRNRVEV